MSETTRLTYTLTVTVDTEDDLPKGPSELALGITEGLPDEWFSPQHEGDYWIVSIEGEQATR